MKDKLKNSCTISYFKRNLACLTVSPFNTETEHCLCEAIDGLSLDADFIFCLSLHDEGDYVTFEPVGKQKLKNILKTFLIAHFIANPNIFV